jgi:hypothetical protein
VVGVDKGTLILYDQETRSRWSQLMGEAISGPLQGKKLVKLPSIMTTWGKWKALHPATTVYVKRSIPYDRRFTENVMALIAKAGEGPLQPNDLVVGLEGHVSAKAYVVRRLAQKRVVNDRLEGAPILVYLSSDLATARVLDRVVEGKTLTFIAAEGDRLKDQETGSLWSPMSGEALSGPLKGKRLSELVSTYSLWFAWKKYRPDTVVYGGES